MDLFIGLIEDKGGWIMSYIFYVSGIAHYEGTVRASSKQEAIQKIKSGDYDDIELVDDSPNVLTIDYLTIDEDE